MKKYIFTIISVFLFNQLHAAPKVVVSIGPIYSIVCGLTTDVTKPYLIMPPNVSHHDYSPTPKNIMAVKDADLLVWVSSGLESFIPKLLEKYKSRNIEFGALQGIKLIKDAHSHDGHSHGEYDPHLWLDPENCILLARQVTKELIEIDPEHADIYKKNESEVIEKLKSINNEMAAKLTDLQKTPFIVYHEGFQYITKKFNLNQVGVLKNHPEQPMSINQYEKILALIKDQHVKTLFVEPQYNDNITAKIAEKTGINLVSLDSMGVVHFCDDISYYIKMMQDVIKSLETGLRK